MTNITSFSRQEPADEATSMPGFTHVKERLEARSLLTGEIVEESSDMIRRVRFAFLKHAVLEVETTRR